MRSREYRYSLPYSGYRLVVASASLLVLAGLLALTWAELVYWLAIDWIYEREPLSERWASGIADGFAHVHGILADRSPQLELHPHFLRAQQLPGKVIPWENVNAIATREAILADDRPKLVLHTLRGPVTICVDGLEAPLSQIHSAAVATWQRRLEAMRRERRLA